MLKKARTGQYPTITDYADDQKLLVNTPAQAKSLLHRLKQAKRCTIRRYGYAKCT